MPVTCVTGMDCELIVCIHRQGVLDAPHVPPPDVPRVVRRYAAIGTAPLSAGFSFAWRLGTAHRHGRGNEAHFFAPTSKFAMATFAKSWRRG